MGDDNVTSLFDKELPVVPLDFTLPTYEWVIDDFIYNGTMLFAGHPGVGKTSCLIPFALAATGLVRFDALQVNTPRKVLYIAEDTDQVKRILFGMAKEYDIDHEILNSMFVLRQAKRVDAKFLAQLNEEARLLTNLVLTPQNEHKNTDPLIVIDTLSATIKMKDENSNSEGADVVSVLREAFRGLPLWLVAHTAKSLKKADVQSLSARGAGAFEGDVQGVFYLFIDPDSNHRVLYGGQGVKRRDQGEISEIEISAKVDHDYVRDAYGYRQKVRFLIPYLAVSDADEREQRSKAQKAENTSVKHDSLVLGAIHELDYPSKKGVADHLKGTLHKDGVSGAIKRLIIRGVVAEGRLPPEVKLRGRQTYLMVTE